MAVVRDPSALAKMLGDEPTPDTIDPENATEAFVEFFNDLNKRVTEGSWSPQEAPTSTVQEVVDAQPEESVDDSSPSQSDTEPTSVDARREPVPGSKAAEPPASEDVEASTSSPAAEASTAPTLAITVDGNQYELDTLAGERLVRLALWTDSLSDEMRQSFAAIEQGEAIAIPRSELKEFAEWYRNKNTPQVPDLEFEDREVAVAFKRMQDEIQDLRAQLRPEPQYQEPQQPNLIDPIAREVEQATAQYAAEHGLTQMELDYLVNQTGQMQLVPQLIQQRVTLSATGQPLNRPNYTEVVRTAYDMAIRQIPELAHRVGAPTSTPSPSPQTSTNRTHQDNVVPIKRARAGALAAAPSASVTTTSGTPLSGQDLNDKIAEFIREAQAEGLG